MMDDDEPRDLSVGDADQERRLRREIANSNERRRMQSINAGFQSLRTLLPHHEGEKLSKAAILQQTAEYIYQLEQEKTRLLSQNSQLKRLYSLSQQGLSSSSQAGSTTSTEEATSPRLKKKRMTSSSLENTADLIKDEQGELYQGQTSVAELSMQLLNEQRLRMRLEERLKSLEQHAANSGSSTAASAPVVPVQQVTATQPVLPTQPLKMEVVNSSVKVPSTAEVRPPPAAILLTDKNGIRVEVETVSGLATTPVSLQIAPKEPTAVVVQPPTQQPTAKAAVEELKTKTPTTTTQAAVATTSRSFIVTSTAAASAASAANAGRHNLDSIVEAIRHLEGDHCFSEDHKVAKEEIVEFQPSTQQAANSASQVQATNLSSHNAAVTVTKNLVPSKIIGLKPVSVVTSQSASSNPIPATLLPKQPHPPSAILHSTQQQSKENSSSIIIVKQCQT